MKKTLAALVAGLALALAPAATSSPPDQHSKLCKPGKNNVGGGPGNSGPGDKHGAPLKPGPGCPGNG